MLKFITRKYKSRRKNKENFYVHCTTAVDTKSVEFVWLACKDVILNNKINSTGIMD